MTLQVGEEDSLWRLELVRGEGGLEATLHRRDYLDTELQVITIVLVNEDLGKPQRRNWFKNSN